MYSKNTPNPLSVYHKLWEAFVGGTDSALNLNSTAPGTSFGAPQVEFKENEEDKW